MDDNLFYFASVASRRPFNKEVCSLQTIVLRVVTTNFEKYMREYKSPDSHIPKYFFEFLQKKYSQELLNNLIDHGNLKPEFLDFVMNNHLKEISLKSVPCECNIGAIKQKIIEIGQGLIRLSLMGAFNFHHLRPVLSHLPNVRKLELEYSTCNDHTIEAIANNCPLLIELNVYASLVSDEGMRYLCFPKGHKLHLESLTVARTYVKTEGILMILKHMPSIQVISHENLSYIIASGAEKNEFPKDEFLNLTYIEVHNAKKELQAVADLCPNIKHLFVKSIDNQEQLQNCCAFKKLEEVCFTYVSRKRSSLCIDHFLKTCGFYVTNLSLENFVISADALVNSCPNLQLLELCDPVFEELPNKTHSSLKFEKLTHFKIYGSSLLSKEDIMSPAFIIQSSPNLEALSLQYCFIGPHMEDVILNCPAKLMQLDFTESLVSINFLQEILLKHKMLQCLILENSGLHSNDYHNLFRLIDTLNHPVICAMECLDSLELLEDLKESRIWNPSI